MKFVYRSEYMKWHIGESDRGSINDEKYDNVYGKPLNDVREQFNLPRTRRFSFMDDYKSDVTESFKDTLKDETLSEDDYQDTYNTQLLSADDLEFLQNEKSPDYTSLKPSDDDETNEREYERVFSRKYKHRKKPMRLEFFDADAKRTMVRRDEDFDYENSEIDEENLGGIEKSNEDISSKIRGLYTEGGIVRPTKYKITPDASGKFSLHYLNRLFTYLFFKLKCI